MKLTVWFAIMWLLTLCTFSSVLIGTLCHELMHKSTSNDIIALQVNYDGSGLTMANNFYDANHSQIYLYGSVVTVCLCSISFLSVFIIMKS